MKLTKSTELISGDSITVTFEERAGDENRGGKPSTLIQQFVTIVSNKGKDSERSLVLTREQFDELRNLI